MSEEGRSIRTIEDARSIVEVKGQSLDRDYLERWAAALGVFDLWREIASGG